jgi:hypothetical protein
MKWLSRSLSLAAWSFWLWLGFGLYRELPRQLGPPVCTLPLERGAMALGWVSDTNYYAIQSAHSRDRDVGILLFDAETGRELAPRSPVPLMKRTFMDANRSAFQVFRSTLRQGVLFGTNPDEREPGERGTREGIQVLHVMSGEWRRLSTKPVAYHVPHPEGPWAVLVERATPPDTDRVVTVNMDTGAVIFSHDFPPRSIVRPPFFVNGADRLLVVPLGRPNSDVTLEIWKVADPKTQVERVEGLDEGAQQFAFSKNGRMHFVGKFRGPRDDLAVYDVYDFNEQRFLTSLPADEQPKTNGGKFLWHFDGRFAPKIAASGRTVLRFAAQNKGTDAKGQPQSRASLYEVDSGRILWTAKRYESLSDPHVENGFRVVEQWDEIWKEWLPNLKFTTHAHRSLEDGRVFFRTANLIPIGSANINSNQTLVVLPDGSVHHLPFLVNYPLLALCQSILALPIVLLWAVLRWRRRRRMRMAGAAP